MKPGSRFSLTAKRTSHHEFVEWIAYFNVLSREEEAKEQAETRAKLEAVKRNQMLGS
jgi:hypothetical protein